MANGTKGEVAFNAAGGGFTLVYDFNALCTIETELGIDPDQLGTISGPSMVRSVFRVGLDARHPGLTDMEAGRLIHDIGMEKAGELIATAFKAAFPDAKPASAEGKAPRAKKAGTTPAH